MVPISLPFQGVLEDEAKGIVREGSCTFQVNTINIYQNGRLWKGESIFSQCLQKGIDTSKWKKVCMFPNRRIFFLAGDMLWLCVEMTKCFCYYPFLPLTILTQNVYVFHTKLFSNSL